MRLSIPALALAFSLLSLAACTRTQPPATPPDAATTIAKATEVLGDVESYAGTMVLTSSLAPFVPPEIAAKAKEIKNVVTTKLATELPNKMKLEISMAPAVGVVGGPPGMEMTGLYDGELLWTATIPPGELADMGLQVGKVSPRPGMPKDRPFDFGYNFQGIGLTPGSDLIATVRELYTWYTFTAAPTTETLAGVSCFHLRGTRTPAKAFDQLVATTPDQVAGVIQTQEQSDDLVDMLARSLKATSTLDLWISRDDYLPRQWSFGDGTITSVTVELRDFDFAAKLPAERFVIDPALAARAVDNTVHVAAARDSLEPILRDEVAIAGLRAKILKKLQ